LRKISEEDKIEIIKTGFGLNQKGKIYHFIKNSKIERINNKKLTVLEKSKKKFIFTRILFRY
jgi:hypothetical protein